MPTYGCWYEAAKVGQVGLDGNFQTYAKMFTQI
jgi:hypothetical protein